MNADFDATLCVFPIGVHPRSSAANHVFAFFQLGDASDLTHYISESRYNPAMRALGFLIAAAAAFAADWPQFRGPNASGVAASDAAPPAKFGSARWKTPLPLGHSSPSVWGDRVFFTSFDPATK